VEPGAELGVDFEGIDEFSGAANAGPVVVPESRYEPGAVSWEHQIRQISLPVKVPPRLSLVGSSLDQYVAPPGIETRSRRVVKYDVRAAGIQIAEPPRLRSGVLPENAKDAVVVDLRRDVVKWLAGSAAFQLERGVGLEDPRQRAPERNRAPVPIDPTGIPFGADAPLAAVLGAPLAVSILGDSCSLLALIGQSPDSILAPQQKTPRRGRRGASGVTTGRRELRTDRNPAGFGLLKRSSFRLCPVVSEPSAARSRATASRESSASRPTSGVWIPITKAV